MTLRPLDPLLDTLGVNSLVRADRLHYATGELLGADDLSAEQTYHRRQLARALLVLHGSGSIAGLRVTATPQINPLDTTRVDEVILTVAPGLAIDRAGRLIELMRPYGLRLKRWFDHLAGAVPDRTPENEDDQQDLQQAFHPQNQAGAGFIIADVFLSFFECDHNPTPTFATGPFDALDASQPSRTRDAHELKLVLRTEPDSALREVPNRPVAFDPWAAALAAAGTDTSVAGTFHRLRVASLNVWNALAVPEQPADGPRNEYPARFDPTAVLLARVRLPARRAGAADVPEGTWTAAAWPSSDARVNNFVRNFIIPPVAAIRAAQSITV